MKNPLSLCGPAECGTNLVKAILGVNKKIHLESEPFLPLFQFLRTEIINQTSKYKKNIKHTEPLSEYYFSKEDLELMKIIQNSNLKVELKKNKLNHLKKQILNRMSDYVPHLKKNINDIKGLNFKEIFDNALKLINKNHNKENIKWLGWLDSWIEEFFPILAKAYPGSKFILILRDPRAAIASSNNYYNKKDILSLAPMTLSFLRCWRKQVAMAEYFNSTPLLKNRCITVKYEDLVRNPKKITKKLCNFLNIKYASNMIDSSNFMGLGQNTKKWVSNSNFNSKQKGIYKTSLFKWKKHLDPIIKNFIELTVGIELKYLGYIKKLPKLSKLSKSKIISYHEHNFRTSKGWRTSKNLPSSDIGLELSRYKYLELKKISNSEIKQNFLFKEAFLAFRNKVIK